MLTPRNDEPDCRIRATDNTKRREILHVLIVRDGEQHPVDIKWPRCNIGSASTGRKGFFKNKRELTDIRHRPPRLRSR